MTPLICVNKKCPCYKATSHNGCTSYNGNYIEDCEISEIETYPEDGHIEAWPP